MYKKKKFNEVKLGDALNDLMREYRLKSKVDEVRVEEAFDKILGESITRHVLSKKVNNKVLFVKLDSAALRSELSYSKSKLTKAINDHLGMEALNDINFG